MAEPDVCPFCERIRTKDHLLRESEHGVVFADGFPVAPGHCLVVSNRHAEHWFDLTVDEQLGLVNLLNEARSIIEDLLHPEGYNLGANIGIYGGQTVFHAHLHLIPRFGRDVADPRGGVRWLVPERAAYWSAHRRPLNYSLVPEGDDRGF